jgi:hypothetical protein
VKRRTELIKTTLNYGLTFLEKISVQTIRAQRFICWHTANHIIHLLGSKRSLHEGQVNFTWQKSGQIEMHMLKLGLSLNVCQNNTLSLSWVLKAASRKVKLTMQDGRLAWLKCICWNALTPSLSLIASQNKLALSDCSEKTMPLSSSMVQIMLVRCLIVAVAWKSFVLQSPDLTRPLYWTMVFRIKSLLHKNGNEMLT